MSRLYSNISFFNAKHQGQYFGKWGQAEFFEDSKYVLIKWLGVP